MISWDTGWWSSTGTPACVCRSAAAALKGHEKVAGGNAPGTVRGKPTDPGRVVYAPMHAPSVGRAFYSTLSGSDSCPARFRGRCPRLLYESPTGILSESRGPGSYAERHKLWHGRPTRDHGRDGRATKGCAIIQVALYSSAVCPRIKTNSRRSRRAGLRGTQVDPIASDPSPGYWANRVLLKISSRCLLKVVRRQGSASCDPR